MFSNILRDLTKPNVLNIIEILKKSQGMTVTEISQITQLSYMGAKQQCEKLESLGYLRKWRMPREAAGRPRVIYILTDKCDSLFPQSGVELSLNVMQGIKNLYGESAPEKILFHHFQELRIKWADYVSRGKSLVEKATRLTELREKSGVFCQCHYTSEKGFRIEEYHNPMKDIFLVFPLAIMQEVRMMEQLLGTKVLREMIAKDNGGEIVIYKIGVLG